MRRRDFLRAAAAAAAMRSLPAPAQGYPSRPVHLVVGFPPGGTTDIVARVLAQRLSDRFGASFVVENKPGAGTNLATEVVVHAPADGHVLLVLTPANAINGFLYRNLPFDFERDIVPVAGLIRSPYVLEIHPALPIETVSELVDYARTHRGKLAIGSFGTGSGSHLSGEMFKMMTGLDMVHVPYRGSAPMLNDLIGGQVQVAFDNLPASVEHIRAGRLRALAVTTAVRSPTLPETPAMSELLPGYESSSWLGIGAPRKTPADVVSTLNREIVAALADQTVRAQLEGLGTSVLTGSPGEIEMFIHSEMEKWAKVIRFSGVRPG
jgi:tripartite-type tricarboxylate transporter receptor subunit TctC